MNAASPTIHRREHSITTNRPSLLTFKERKMYNKINELLPEYRDAFTKVLEKHRDIKQGIKKLQYQAKNYNKFKEKMRQDNIKLVE